MNSDVIKQLIEKHFGSIHKSLTIGEAGEEDGSAYYYTLENEDEIVALTELLETQNSTGGLKKVPELEQSFSQRNDELPQCVCFSEYEGCWYISLHRITGVKYHRTVKRHIVSTLVLDKYPSIRLSNRNEDELDGFGAKLRSRKHAPYMDADGLSYWMNKALQNNLSFRAFAIDYFYAEAERTHRYILKDVARTIEKFGCFLLPISFPELITFRTPADLIGRFKDEEIDLNIDYNKVDLNFGYIMTVLAKGIDKRDWKLIPKLDSKTVANAITLKQFYDGFTAGEFVKAFYNNQYDDYDVETYVKDYVEMCLETGQKLRINFSSEAALIAAHDDLAYEIRNKVDENELRLPLVAEDSRFDALEEKIAEIGNGEFERIKTTAQLFIEGKAQHNCVFSRRNVIRKDKAAVFHWHHNGREYTIQFKIDRWRRYAVEEVRARFNETITEQDLSELKRLLSDFCTVGDDLAVGIRPQLYGIDVQNMMLLGDDEDLPF